MKKVILAFAVVLCTMFATAQTNQYFWLNGNLMFGTRIAQTDSITFSDIADIDTLHLLLPRSIIKEVHDTVQVAVHDTIYINKCAESNDGALAGVFSVSATKKVRFSKGNLQYQVSTDTWRFSENQWDYVGDATNGTIYENGIKCDNNLISSTYSGWIDLFGWGTGKNPTNASTDKNDYTTFVDWGVNAISNGGNVPNQWRTLTYDEWYYIFYTRSNAANLRGQATVNGVHGYIFMADNFVFPSGLSFTANQYNNYNTNVYTIADWTRIETAGAIFLPAADYRNSLGVVRNVGNYGYYWSSSVTTFNEYGAHLFYFQPADDGIGSFDNFGGCAVRLVQDVE